MPGYEPSFLLTSAATTPTLLVRRLRSSGISIGDHRQRDLFGRTRRDGAAIRSGVDGAMHPLEPPASADGALLAAQTATGCKGEGEADLELGFVHRLELLFFLKPARRGWTFAVHVERIP